MFLRYCRHSAITLPMFTGTSCSATPGSPSEFANRRSLSFAQNAAATALDGIARNPGAADKIQGPMILGLALIESLVIYSLIIAFILVGKI